MSRQLRSLDRARHRRRRRRPGRGTPIGSASSPSPAAVLVELLLGGGWIDISSYVRYADQIKITRGRTDEGGQVQRGTCRFTVNNGDGRFSPRNPLGAWYGLIGHNTPCRVSVPYQGGRAFRFHGELSDLPVQWDISGTDVWVEVQASGILQRLEQGATPLKSSPRRWIEAHSPVFYRHLEEGPLTPLSSSAAKVNFKYGEGDLAPWLLPSLQIVGITGTSTGIVFADAKIAKAVEFSIDFMYASDTDKSFTFRVFAAGGESGFSLALRFAPSTSQVVLIYTPDSTGVDQTISTTSTTAPFDNRPHHVRLQAENNGANVDITVWLDGVLLDSDTKTSAAITSVRAVWLFPYAGSDGSFLAIGHLAGWTTAPPSVVDAAEAALGYQGEAAGRRVERLCSEEGITFTPVGNLDDTALLGPQFPDAFVTILRESAETDAGILFESRDRPGLAYRTRMSLYNQAAALALIYTNSELLTPPSPTDDDSAVRNDVTVNRREGGSQRRRLESGPLSVLAPEDGGVGVYDEATTLNVASDAQLPNQAGWRLHLGTVDEARYPSLELHLARAAISEGMRLSILDVELGGRVTVDDLPAWIPPNLVTTLVQGTSEVLDQFEHVLEFITSPESPYQVGVYEAAEGDPTKYDTLGSSLAAAFVAGTDVSMSVSIDLGPLWTTAVAQFPFDIECGGARLTVTAISGASSPQTFTVSATPVNGVAKIIPAGTAVKLWTPAVYALG